MIINPLFIKPENPGFMGETIKSKFSNSSYLFSDIIKIVGLNDKKQLKVTATNSNDTDHLLTNFPIVTDKNNSSYNKVNLQAVNNIVSSLLKQHGVNQSDDPLNFQGLNNIISKIALNGKPFKINLAINDKNIDINITPVAGVKIIPKL